MNPLTRLMDSTPRKTKRGSINKCTVLGLVSASWGLQSKGLIEFFLPVFKVCQLMFL